MKALMSTKMSEGTPVHDHVLKMMDHFNMLEILGAKIDGQTQADIILESWLILSISSNLTIT